MDLVTDRTLFTVSLVKPHLLSQCPSNAWDSIVYLLESPVMSLVPVPSRYQPRYQYRVPLKCQTDRRRTNMSVFRRVKHHRLIPGHSRPLRQGQCPSVQSSPGSSSRPDRPKFQSIRFQCSNVRHFQVRPTALSVPRGPPSTAGPTRGEDLLRKEESDESHGLSLCGLESRPTPPTWPLNRTMPRSSSEVLTEQFEK